MPMTDYATLTVNSVELRAAAKALKTVVAANAGVDTSDAELEAAVRCLFELLHRELADFGWRPQALTLAPWAVEVVARLLARQTAAALPSPNKRTVKATLAPAPALPLTAEAK
jgi:hypothetical protein